MNDSYALTNFQIAGFVLGPLAIVLLLWLLTPSVAYRTAHCWLLENGGGNSKNWLHYKSLKRLLTLRDIAMNAANRTEFTSDDLNLLNGLFAKLGQPSAALIRPKTGECVDRFSMDVENSHDEIRDRLIVLEVLSDGVTWKDLPLRKAVVRQCGPDCLMLHRLAEMEAADEIVTAFAKYCQENGLLHTGLRLGSGELKGFIDIQMRPPDKARLLFEALKVAHPDQCFAVIEPPIGCAFDNNTMTPLGGTIPGQHSEVQEVRRCGIARTSNPKWTIKAIVKI
jgi:hypothetical protein